MILYPPTSLQDLRSLSDCITVSCVGSSWPTAQPCKNVLDKHDDAFICAVQKLQSLSGSGLKNHREGLIEILTSVAQGFSCKIHRLKPGQREQLPYYWIALDNMPKFLDCMGLKFPVARNCSDEKKTMIHDAVHELTADAAWYVHNALIKMDSNELSQWWKEGKNGAVANYFRNVLTKKLSNDGTDIITWREQRSAEKKWQTWRLSLIANNDDDEGNDLQDETELLSGIETENDLDFLSASSDFSDGRNLWTNRPFTPKDKFLPAELEFTVGPASAPIDMQTTSSRNQPLPTPTKQPRRRSHIPSSSSGSIHSNRTARNASPHRLSVTQDRLERPNILQEQQQQQALNGQVGPFGGDYVALSSERLQQGSPSSSNHAVDALPSPESTVSAVGSSDSTMGEVMDCHLDTAISTSLVEESRGPAFHDYGPKLSNAEVTGEVFKIMRKPLNITTTKAQEQKDKGYIYALKLSNRPGFIKIGRTKTNIRHREKAIKTCTGGELELFNYSDNCSVMYHKRVEALVHAALCQSRRAFKCDCKLKGKCSDKKFVEHGEWFEIDEQEATKAACSWRAWMNGNPYHNGHLKDREEARIRFYEKRISDILHRPERRGTDLLPFDWDEFMSNRGWNSYLAQIIDFFVDDRPERNNYSSRQDSLKKHWAFNTIAFGCFFVYPFFMSVVIHCTSWSSWFAIELSLACSGLAILYAA